MTLAEARVLIVDDEPELRNLFARWLIHAGCTRTRTAENGRDALERIDEDEADVLITDVRMPVMDGVTLVKILCDRAIGIPCIIFVTGAAEIDYREMYGCGVEAFLGKPFHMEELGTALRRAVAERDELWNLPMTHAPGMSITVSPTHGTVSTRAPLSGSEAFQLGRGGFSAQVEDAPGSGKVSFDFRPLDHVGVPEKCPRLCGQGFVRWRSRAEQRAGIEFAYLESPGREWVASQIKARNPNCFIPA